MVLVVLEFAKKTHSPPNVDFKLRVAYSVPKHVGGLLTSVRVASGGI